MKTSLVFSFVIFLLSNLYSQEFMFSREVFITEKDLGKLGFYITDNDHDGNFEFITDANDQGIIFTGQIENNEIKTLHRTPGSIFSSDFKDLRYEDTDKDGKMELYVLQDSEGLIQLDTATLEGLDTISTFPIPPTFKKIIMADIDDDLVNEWIMLDDGSGITVFELSTFTEIWNAPELDGRDMRIGNLDDDPALELVILASSGIKIINIETLEEEYFIPSSSYDAIDLTDLNRDGKDELILVDGTLLKIYDHISRSIIDEFSTGSIHYDDHFYRNVDDDPNLEIVLYQPTFKAFIELNTYPLEVYSQFDLGDEDILGTYTGLTTSDSNVLIFLPDEGLTIFNYSERKTQTTTITGPPFTILSGHFENYPHELLVSHPAESNWSYLTFKSLTDFNTIKTVSSTDLFEGYIANFGSTVNHFHEKGINPNQLFISNFESFSLYDVSNDEHHEHYDIPGTNLMAVDLDNDGGDELIAKETQGIHVYHNEGQDHFIPLFTTAPPQAAVQLRVGQLDKSREKEIIAFNFQSILIYSGKNGSVVREVTAIPDGTIQDLITYTDSSGDFFIGVMQSGIFYIYNYSKDILSHSFTIEGGSGHANILQVLQGDILKSYILIYTTRFQVYTTDGDLVFLGEAGIGNGSGTGNIIITDYDQDLHPNIITSSTSKFTEYEYSGAGIPVDPFYVTSVFPKDSIKLSNPTSFILQFSEPVLLSSIQSNIFIMSKKQGSLDYIIEKIGDHQIKLTHESLVNNSDVITLIMRGGLRSGSLKFPDTNEDGISLGNLEPIVFAVYLYETSSPGQMLNIIPIQSLPEYVYKGSKRHLPFQVTSAAGNEIQIPIAFIHSGIISNGNTTLDSVLPIDLSFDETNEEVNIPVDALFLEEGHYTEYIVAGDFAGNLSDTFFYHFLVISENGFYDKNAGGDATRTNHFLNKVITTNLKKLTVIPKASNQRITHIVGGDNSFYFMESRFQEDSISVWKIGLTNFEPIWEKRFPAFGLSGSPHLDKGILFFFNRSDNSSEPYLYAYDIISGKEIWKHEYYSGIESVSPPITDANNILVDGGEHGGTYCFDRWTGHLNWHSKRFNDNFEQGNAAIYKNAAYLVENTTIKSVDLLTGNKKWEIDVNDEASYLVHRNAIADTINHQIIWAGKSFLFAYDLDTGNQRWKVPGDNSVKNPVLDQNLIFLFNSNSIRVYNATTGAFIKQQGLPSNIAYQPIISNGKLFIPLADRFEILEEITLQTIWNEPLKIQEISVIDHYLLLTDTGDDIHIYESLDQCCNPSIEWTEAFFSGSVGDVSSLRYTFDSIAILQNGKYYYEILSSNLEFGGNWQHTGKLIRNADNKIYQGLPAGEITLIDFNLGVNENFVSDNGVEYTVTGIDSIILENGEIRKQLELHCDVWGNIPIYWIEGIGSSAGLALNDITCMTDVGGALLCLSQNGNILYDNPDYNTCWLNFVSTEDFVNNKIKFYPNPAQSEIVINDPDQVIKSFAIIDILGQEKISGIGLKVNLDMLPSGCYNLIFKMKTGNCISGKFIKL